MKKKYGYVDGYVIPIPKKNLAAYRRMATLGCKIWMEYGAIEYCECVGDELKSTWGIPFPKMAKAKPSETVLFSWIVYESKKHRDKVNALVMKDPRLAKMMDPKKPVFDMRKFAYGGFKVLISK